MSRARKGLIERIIEFLYRRKRVVAAPMEVVDTEGGRVDYQKAIDAADTYIGKDAVITGSLVVGGRVVVEGVFSGLVTQSSRGAALFVADGGVVRGSVDVSNTLISGVVEGRIQSPLICIEKHASVKGALTYESMIADGGLSEIQIRKDDALVPLIVDETARERMKK